MTGIFLGDLSEDIPKNVQDNKKKPSTLNSKYAYSLIDISLLSVCVTSFCKQIYL